MVIFRQKYLAILALVLLFSGLISELNAQELLLRPGDCMFIGNSDMQSGEWSHNSRGNLLNAAFDGKIISAYIAQQNINSGRNEQVFLYFPFRFESFVQKIDLGNSSVVQGDIVEQLGRPLRE